MKTPVVTALFFLLLIPAISFAQSATESAIARKWIMQTITVNGIADPDRYPVNNDVMQFNADHSFHSVDNTFKSADDGTWKLTDASTVQMEVLRNGERKTYSMKIINVSIAQLVLEFVNADGDMVVLTLKAS